MAALLHTILMIMITATVLGFFAMISHPNPLIVASALSLLLFVELITFALMRLKKEGLSALILVSGLWISFVSLSAISEGLANSAFFGLVLVVTIAGLTLGGRGRIDLCRIERARRSGLDDRQGKQSPAQRAD